MQPDLTVLGAQDRQPEAVEGVDGDASSRRSEQVLEALAQLLGGAPGEGDRQVLLRLRLPRADQVGDAVGQGAGLAGAGAGDDQERPGDHFRRRPLVGVGAVEGGGRRGFVAEGERQVSPQWLIM